MDKIMAWIGTLTFFLNLGLCINGSEASWFLQLLALGAMVVYFWIEALD